MTKKKSLKDFEKLDTANDWSEYLGTMVLTMGRGELPKFTNPKEVNNACGKVSQLHFRKMEHAIARKEKPDVSFWK